MPKVNACIACGNCGYDPQSGWWVCEKRGGLTPGKRCDDFELSATTDLEDLEPGEYTPLIEDPILTPEQMATYYMGYAEGLKWAVKHLQELCMEGRNDKTTD